MFDRISRWANTPLRQGIVTWVVFLGLSVALLAASGCAVGGEDHQDDAKPGMTPTSGLDDAGRKACDLFAEYAADEFTPWDDRLERIRPVHQAASNSLSGEIDAKAEVLFRVAPQVGTESWALAADSFASECLTRGWKP